MKLNLGCGKDYRKGFVNVDFYRETKADIICDLNDRLPFKDNIFSYILCSHVLEHLDDLIKTVDELWRVAKPNAIIEILVPHFRAASAFDDPTHKLFFGFYTFDCFTNNPDCDTPNYYTKAKLELLIRGIPQIE